MKQLQRIKLKKLAREMRLAQHTEVIQIISDLPVLSTAK